MLYLYFKRPNVQVPMITNETYVNQPLFLIMTVSRFFDLPSQS